MYTQKSPIYTLFTHSFHTLSSQTHTKLIYRAEFGLGMYVCIKKILVFLGMCVLVCREASHLATQLFVCPIVYSSNYWSYPWLCVCVCMCVCACVCMCVCACVCMCVCACVCMCVEKPSHLATQLFQHPIVYLSNH